MRKKQGKGSRPFSISNIFAQFQCPEVEFCIEQQDPNIPTYTVTLDFSGTLTDIWGFNVTGIVDGVGTSTVNNISAQMVHPDMLNFGISAWVSGGSGHVQLTEILITPTMSLSNAPMDIFSFTYSGDVGECFASKILTAKILYQLPDMTLFTCDAILDGDVCPAAIPGLQYCFPGINISGLIESDALFQECDGSVDHGIDNVAVRVVSPFATDCTYITHADGTYTCEVLPGYSYLIQPSKDDNPGCGITTLDLSLISTFLNTNYSNYNSWSQMIASDMNNDFTITASDALKIRQVVLGNSPVFDSWGFIPSTQFGSLGVYTSGTNSIPYFDDEIFVFIPTSNVSNQEFIGIKKGDINGSCTDCSGTQEQPNMMLAPTTTDELQILIEDQKLKKGEERFIPVQARGFDQISVFGLGLKLDTKKIQVLGIEPADLNGLTEEDFNLKQIRSGEIRHLWYDKQFSSQTLSENEILFYIKLQAKEDIYSLQKLIRLEENLMENIAFLENGDPLNISFELNQSSNSEPFAFPNPTNQSTNIYFNLPTSTEVEISIFDNTGKLLLQDNGYFNQGQNTWTVQTENIASQGLLIYQIKSGDYFYSGKIIKTE